jgi:hypothetical protein
MTVYENMKGNIAEHCLGRNTGFLSTNVDSLDLVVCDQWKVPQNL